MRYFLSFFRKEESSGTNTVCITLTMRAGKPRFSNRNYCSNSWIMLNPPPTPLIHTWIIRLPQRQSDHEDFQTELALVPL